MKNQLLGLLFLGFIACDENRKEEAADQATFIVTVMDTLVIDPGNEILYLQYYLIQSQTDPDSRYLYNYNRGDNALEVIDLDSLRLDKKIRFDKEGPNGTGGYIQHVHYNGGNKILLAEFHQISLFNTKAEKVFQLNIVGQKFEGDTLNENESLVTGGLLDEEENFFITTYNQGFGEPLGIAKVHLQDKTLKKIPIPGLKDLAKFRVSFSDGQSKSASYPGVNLQLLNGKVLVSNSAVNELYTYDVRTDSLVHYLFKSRIMADRQKENPRTRVHSQEELNQVARERAKDVSFNRFVYDIQNKRYYRFSQKFEKETPEENIFSPVLTVFDDSLNQIFETDKLPIEKTFWKYFVKDSKLYLYENIEDEMGFIVLEIEKI